MHWEHEARPATICLDAAAVCVPSWLCLWRYVFACIYVRVHETFVFNWMDRWMAVSRSAEPNLMHAYRVQVLSWKPRAFVYHNFLSKAELKHILELAAPQVGAACVATRMRCLQEWSR
eukprot:359833-Chlamydomonas_euryale.AAC.11